MEKPVQDAEFQTMWNEALSEYQRTTGINLLDRKIPKPASPENLLDVVDQEHGKFSDFRDKRAMLFKVMSLSLKPVEMFGNLAAGGATMVSFEPALVISC